MAYTSRHVTYHQSLQQDVSTLLRREHTATIRYFSTTNRAPINRQGTTHNTSSSGAASSGKEATTKQSNFPSLAYVDIPHSQIRKVTASRLAFSKQTIPHYYLTVDPYVDKLMGSIHSKRASGGKQISVNDLVVKINSTLLLTCLYAISNELKSIN
ncbi:hypothetical protein Bca4012_037163 [Brassica carinata]